MLASRNRGKRLANLLEGDFGPAAGRYGLGEIFQIIGHDDRASGLGLSRENHITLKGRRRRRWMAAASSCRPELGSSTQGARVEREITKEGFQQIEPCDRLLEVLMKKLPPKRRRSRGSRSGGFSTSLRKKPRSISRCDVGSGQVVCIIGPNCAGKTTVLKAVAGLIPVRRGKIVFDGRELIAEPAHERVRHRLCLIHARGKRGLRSAVGVNIP